MEKKILVGVDGTRKGLETISVVGRLLKDQADTRIVLFHAVQKVAALLSKDLCSALEECSIAYPDEDRMGKIVLDECKRYFINLGFPESRIETKLKTESVDPAQDLIVEADAQGIQTIVVGRRSKSQVQRFLLGSVSNKVAQYATEKSVWIVDSPLNDTRSVMLAIDGNPASEKVIRYAADHLAGIPGLKFIFLHITPPVPPTFWDDGHILNPQEQKEREARIERWRIEWKRKVDSYISQGRSLFKSKGVSEEDMDSFILPLRQGVARDLLNEVAVHKFFMAIFGRESGLEKTPFIMGSVTGKILQSIKGTVLCLTD